MLTKEERDALRAEFEASRNKRTSDGSSFYPTLHRAQLWSALDALDALDEMEAERDEFRELLRMERSACYVAEQAADVGIAIKEKAQRERDEVLAALRRCRYEAQSPDHNHGQLVQAILDLTEECDTPVQSVWRPHPDGGLVGGGEDGREFWVKRHPEGGWMLLWRGQWAGGHSEWDTARAMQQAWWLQAKNEGRALLRDLGRRPRWIEPEDAPPEWTTLPEGWEPDEHTHTERAQRIRHAADGGGVMTKEERDELRARAEYSAQFGPLPLVLDALNALDAMEAERDEVLAALRRCRYEAQSPDHNHGQLVQAILDLTEECDS